MAHNIPPDDRRCTARSKTALRLRAEGEDIEDDRCPMWAVRGATVCYHHGGNAPHVKAAAAERLRTREIQAYSSAVLAQEGVETIEDPLAELSRLAASSQGLMHALGQRVNSLTELEHFDAKNSPAIKAEVQMFERAMDRTARLLESLVKAGYTERQIKIAESEAMMVAGVLKRVISALGLTNEQQAMAQRLLAEEFRSLAPKPMKSINS